MRLLKDFGRKAPLAEHMVGSEEECLEEVVP